MSSTLNDESVRTIAKLFAEKFIARPGVKAIQRANGDYNPIDSKFTMPDLLAHIRGEQTYGHYLLNETNQCKLFVFDIDLDKWDKIHPENNEYLRVPTAVDSDGVWHNFMPCDPREIWLDRSAAVARQYLKYQLRMTAQILAEAVTKQLEIPVAATYTGSKGLHVYGFTGLMPASDVREGAQLIIDSLSRFTQHRGNNFFKHKLVHLDDPSRDETESYQCLTLEVFPKQVELDGGGYGNLCRLPLGVNKKNPKDPTFFLDFRTDFGLGAIHPRDAVDALTCKSYWS